MKFSVHGAEVFLRASFKAAEVPARVPRADQADARAGRGAQGERIVDPDTRPAQADGDVAGAQSKLAVMNSPMMRPR